MRCESRGRRAGHGWRWGLRSRYSASTPLVAGYSACAAIGGHLPAGQRPLADPRSTGPCHRHDAKPDGWFVGPPTSRGTAPRVDDVCLRHARAPEGGPPVAGVDGDRRVGARGRARDGAVPAADRRGPGPGQGNERKANPTRARYATRTRPCRLVRSRTSFATPAGPGSTRARSVAGPCSPEVDEAEGYRASLLR